ncbi:chloride channel protein 7 isoform X4 [Oratosquilla oratoria]|uniref:chloride channel protein 7 isoform X4 n=1 Tax=Oratosquilla oratoria TaxID=337810 RepID=UPI003F774FA5
MSARRFIPFVNQRLNEAEDCSPLTPPARGRAQSSQNFSVNTSNKDIVDGNISVVEEHLPETSPEDENAVEMVVPSRSSSDEPQELVFATGSGSTSSCNQLGNSIFYSSAVPADSVPQDERGELNILSAEYESLDYDTCINSVWLDEERTRGYKFITKKDAARWLVVMITGILTALVACVIDITIESLSKFKYTWLQHNTNKYVTKNLAIPYFLWGALNIGPVLVAAFLGSYVEPLSAGSGIPQVKCYLNGVKVPRVVRIKTLLSKAVGVTMSVLGGLAVGKEGPMIHSGAVIAAGVSQGKTTSFNKDFGFFEYFREDHEKRDFVSAGAAAGVSAAFGAPVGGVLFSLEEGASFWNQSLTWRVFFGAMVSSFTLNLVLSAYNGVPGQLTYTGLLNFGAFDDLTYQIWEFIPFILMGILGGLLGALYNYINYRLTVFRMRYVQQPWRKIIEAVIVAFFTATIGFFMIYFVNDCRRASEDQNTLYPIQMFCDEGDENAVASIWFQTPEQSVRSLFHAKADAYKWQTISVFFVCYFILACWTYGLGVPAGLFIPTLLTGAAWGRLVGMLIHLLFPSEGWADEGKYALVGAAAMLGGVVRMTLSLTVILMECTGNITFGLPLMIVLMVAKWVGDYFNEGLYDIHIQMSGVPIMAWEAPPLSNNIYASEVMNRPVISLQCVEKVSRIVEVLKQCTYNGFPVVDQFPEGDDAIYFKSFGKLRGIILRSQLVVLLKNKVFNENAEVWQEGKVDIHLFRKAYPRYYQLHQVNLDEEDMNKTVDLKPFMNPSPYNIISCTALPRVFSLFRALGLRHLVICNDANEVVGMVTRKDLVKYRVWKHRGQMGLEELAIYNRV